MTSISRLAAGLLALALFAAACGASDAEAPTADELPINPAATCVETQPDCQDTIDADEPLFLDGEPTDGLEPGAAVVGGAVTPDGGLTVADALASDAIGVLAVKGFVVSDDDGPRLCELLAESLPPLCGGAWIELARIDMIDPDEFNESQGVTWTDGTVTLVGEIVNGVFTPTPFSL